MTIIDRHTEPTSTAVIEDLSDLQIMYQLDYLEPRANFTEL